MNLASIYQSLVKGDPSGKTAAAFLADLRQHGIDVSDVVGDPSPSDATKPRSYSDSPNASHVAGAQRRRYLTGEQAAEFRSIFGPAEDKYIGPSRAPDGSLRISAGCPRAYAEQQERRRGSRT